MSRVFDLAGATKRELNQALQRTNGSDASDTWRVVNPRGLHNLAVGLDAPLAVDIEGHVGYYCAGMNQRATVDPLHRDAAA